MHARYMSHWILRNHGTYSVLRSFLSLRPKFKISMILDFESEFVGIEVE